MRKAVTSGSFGAKLALIMKIKVRFFAICRELAGTDIAELELPKNADKQLLWNELYKLYPDLSAVSAHVALAVNDEYSAGDFTLHDGDEISLIPPVSGG